MKQWGLSRKESVSPEGRPRCLLVVFTAQKKKRKHILRTHTGGMVSGKKRVKVVAAFRYGKVFRVTLFVVHFAFFKFGAITAGVTPSSIRCKARWSIQNFFDVAGHVRILFFLPMLASRFFPPAHYTL